MLTSEQRAQGWKDVVDGSITVRGSQKIDFMMKCGEVGYACVAALVAVVAEPGSIIAYREVSNS